MSLWAVFRQNHDEFGVQRHTKKVKCSFLPAYSPNSQGLWYDVPDRPVSCSMEDVFIFVWFTKKLSASLNMDGFGHFSKIRHQIYGTIVTIVSSLWNILKLRFVAVKFPDYTLLANEFLESPLRDMVNISFNKKQLIQSNSNTLQRMTNVLLVAVLTTTYFAWIVVSSGSFYKLFLTYIFPGIFALIKLILYYLMYSVLLAAIKFLRTLILDRYSAVLLSVGKWNWSLQIFYLFEGVNLNVEQFTETYISNLEVRYK